jgi:hypothetical protein
MALDSQGNTILVGNFGGTCDFNPGPGTENRTATGPYDGFVAKYDPNGALLWAGAIGGDGDQRVFTVALDGVDNIYIDGWFELDSDMDPGAGSLLVTSAGEFDGFFSKLDPAGQLIWANPLPNTERSFVSDMEISPSTGDVIITGCFRDTIDMDPSTGSFPLSTDVLGAFYEANTNFLARYSNNGAVLWAERLGGANDGPVVSIHDDGFGNEVINWGTVGQDNDISTSDLDPGSGFVHPTDQGAMPPAEWIGIVQFDAGGTYQWSHLMRTQIGTDGEIASDLLGLVTDPSGNIVIVGSFEDAFSAYPGNDVTLATFGVTNNDGFMIKLSASGSLIWEKHMGNGVSSESESLVDIAIDATGNYWVTGVFADGAEMDSDALGHTIGSNGEFDIAVIGFDASGNYLWHSTVGGDWYDSNPQLCAIGDDLVLSGSYGTFTGTADLDISAGVQAFTAIDIYDAFITRFTPSITTSIGLNTTNDHDVMLWPNPASDEVHLGGPSVKDPAVYDQIGHCMPIAANKNTVDVSQWPNGMYTVRPADGSATRLIIQH